MYRRQSLETAVLAFRHMQEKRRSCSRATLPQVQERYRGKGERPFGVTVDMYRCLLRLTLNSAASSVNSDRHRAPPSSSCKSMYRYPYHANTGFDHGPAWPTLWSPFGLDMAQNSPQQNVHKGTPPPRCEGCCPRTTSDPPVQGMQVFYSEPPHPAQLDPSRFYRRVLP